MLKNSSMRPAYATVGSQGTDGKASGNEYLSFSAGQVEDDFNSFGDTSSKIGASAQRRRPQQKKARPSNTPRRRNNPFSNLDT